MVQTKASSFFSFKLLQPYFWYIFLLAVALVLIIVPLFQKGTFIDGMLYKTVAFNYYKDNAGFWKMKFTNTNMSEFCEQPPLYFYLLGNFYKLFGADYSIDRVFTFLLFVLLIWGLLLVVKQLFKQWQLYFLWAVFFLLAVPVFCWSYVNQVIEPLVNVCAIFGILCFVNYIKKEKIVGAVYFGLILILLFLSKGFQSCFLVVLPAAYFVLNHFNKKTFQLIALTSVVFLAVMLFLLYYYSASIEWFKCYFNMRLVLTFQNTGSTTDNHIEIIVRFFTEQVVLLLFTTLIFFLLVKKKYRFKTMITNFWANKLAVALLITSLAGSFPYALSLVQRGFYLVPSFICFTLAILLGFRRYWLLSALFFNRISKNKLAQVVNMIVFIGALSYLIFFVRDYKRDKELITDLEKITPILKDKSTLHIEGRLWNYISLHALLYRSKEISISSIPVNSGYFLAPKQFNPVQSNLHLKKLEIETKELDLYEKSLP